MTTRSKIEVASPEGKKFLRRVVKDTAKLISDEHWQVRASNATDWRFEFSRIIKAKQIGDADELIVVETDAKVSLPSDQRFGMVQAFSDAEPVDVRHPTRVYCNGESWQVAKLLAEGWDFEVHASPGSSSSSQHGLSFYYIYATDKATSYYGMTVGGETVAVRGRPVIRGAVDID